MFPYKIKIVLSREEAHLIITQELLHVILVAHVRVLVVVAIVSQQSLQVWAGNTKSPQELKCREEPEMSQAAETFASQGHWGLLRVDTQPDSPDKESHTEGKGLCKPSLSQGNPAFDVYGFWLDGSYHNCHGSAFTDVRTMCRKVILSSCPPVGL
jgi:hypothetical protein